MVRTGTPATTVLGATFFVMTAPSPKALGWPNEVSPQGRKSPSGHHRLLVPWRRFAQAEHRHGHPDRLRPWRTRNAPAARCAYREAVRLGERSELRSSRKAPRRQVPRRATRGALRSKVARGCAVLQQDRVARRGGKADPLAGGPPPRSRPARLRGNHGRSRHGRRRRHERNAARLLPRWMHRLLCPQCQRRPRGRRQRRCELRQLLRLRRQVRDGRTRMGNRRVRFLRLAGAANRNPIPSSGNLQEGFKTIGFARARILLSANYQPSNPIIGCLGYGNNNFLNIPNHAPYERTCQLSRR